MPETPTLLLSDRVVDLVRGEVRAGTVRSPLTARELALLSFLARTPEQVVPRDTLLAEVWGHRSAAQSRAVDLAVLRLRGKLEAEPHLPRHLLTVFGEGYRLAGVRREKPPGNLPPELDRGFGLEGPVAALEAILGRHRAVTLVGPFGVGKSRLAAALARRLEARYRGGAWWCDVRDDAGGAVARSLSVPRESVHLALAGRPPTLLVLDGLDGEEATLPQWLRANPGLSLIVTSRRPLVLPGGRLFEVTPLAETDALALLADRAAAMGRTVPEDTSRALVARLDRLPLAIELAATQTWTFAPDAILERLESAVYDGLAAMVQQACDTLGPVAARVLEVCATFEGGFTPEAVEAVTRQAFPGSELSVGVGLRELRERSLISRADDRLRVLACVRDVVVARAPRALLDAHVRWAAALGSELAEAVERSGRPEAWRRLTDERANLRVAWERAEPDDRRSLVRAMGPLLAEEGRATYMIEDALAGAGPAEEGALRMLRGRLRRVRGTLDQAVEDLTAAIPLLPEGTLDARIARFTLALCEVDRGRPGVALTHLEPLAATEPPDAITGAAAAQRGRALRSLGHLAAARAATLEGLDILQRLGARRLEATALAVLSDLYDGAPDRPARMLTHLQEALRIHREERNLRGEAVTLSNLVNTLADLERWEEVWPVAEQARVAHEALGARRSEGILLTNLSGIALSCFELDRAEALGARAVRICRANGLTSFEALAWLNLGMAALARGAPGEAEERFTTARLLYDGDTLMRAVCDAALAAAEAAQDRLSDAGARFDRIDIAVLSGRPALRATVGLCRGFLDLAHARARPDGGHLAAARQRLEVLSPASDTTEVRGMARLLERAIAAHTE